MNMFSLTNIWVCLVKHSIITKLVILLKRHITQTSIETKLGLLRGQFKSMQLLIP